MLTKYGTFFFFWECGNCHQIVKTTPQESPLCNCDKPQTENDKVAKEQWIHRTDLEEQEHE